MCPAIETPRGAASPQPFQLIGDPRDRFGVRLGGAEVPGRCETSGIFRESLRKHKVSAKRLEDELPRPDGGRASNQARSTCEESPEEVRDELVACPIAATDRIAGASTREGDAMIFDGCRREERLPVRSRHQLGATLGIGIWIPATHGLILAVSPHPFSVCIAFVARDIDEHTRLFKLPNGFHDVNSTHNVGGIGF